MRPYEVMVIYDAELDEPGHRAAAPELAVVGVRRQHERALPRSQHRPSSSQKRGRRG